MPKSDHKDWIARTGGGMQERIESRREAAQGAHAIEVTNKAVLWLTLLVPGPLLVFGWFLPGRENPNIAIPYAILNLVMLITTAVSIGKLVTLARLRGSKVFVMSEEGNDPTDAVAALERLSDIMRAPRTDQRKLVIAYEDAIDRLQAMIPHKPLSRVVRYGYYPSRPKVTVSENTYRIVNNDEDDGSVHWERAMTSIDDMRTLLKGKPIVLETEVETAISSLIPPLRAVLRTHGVPTWRIERKAPELPAGRIAVEADVPPDGDETPKRPPTAAAVDDHEIATVTEAERRPMREDGLTRVDDRLNATGTMVAMALRSLETAFRAANPSLFLGDDRATGETMLDEHLPRLVDAFIVADDASKGEERDQVRADFARSLGFIRETLENVMTRHVTAARQLLEDQARFIESRHGSGPLSPD